MVQAGAAVGHVRSATNSNGVEVEATPSTAVAVLGLDDVPSAGEPFRVFPDEKEARKAAEARPVIGAVMRAVEAVFGAVKRCHSWCQALSLALSSARPPRVCAVKRETYMKYLRFLV